MRFSSKTRSCIGRNPTEFTSHGSLCRAGRDTVVCQREVLSSKDGGRGESNSATVSIANLETART